MLSSRSTHYWLWFLLFGVVSSLTVWSRQHTLDSESVWLLVTGIVGIVVGGLGGRLARPYDLLIGLLFTGVGMLGILHNFGFNLVAERPTAPGLVDTSAILGLSLSLAYALIHTLLGLTSLNSGLRARVATSAVTVETARASA